jgi:TonB-dependent SusC/RagA subfamily outer membrane receptor
MSRFPGVTVTRTSNGIAIRIRGATSLRGSNEPLYVIDGMRIRPGPDGSLAGLDPHDIEMIQVLKDAVSMVTYGGDAANGVIVIKTKGPR